MHQPSASWSRPTPLLPPAATEQQISATSPTISLKPTSTQPPPLQLMLQQHDTSGSDMPGWDASASNDSVTPPYTSSELNVMGATAKDEPHMGPQQGAQLLPIDMRDPERTKLEKRRLLKRIAKAKYRQRKLDYISKLETEASALNTENVELMLTATNLCGELLQLKKKLTDHVSHGCQIKPPHAP
ncbi:hypothetical protein HPB50_010152 [Hyalomma asiaticum]|uniref:Uncharacterized protein n=1 Tax=Hyalomma asiaticum TaxID=266040 RepID=A0ACB7T1U4_HYAAI|nr:hypothetical protein HPB50_010152 [Hyalomma asiaticum]